MNARPEIVKMQRAQGSANLHMKQGNIETLYQSGSSKIILPKTYQPAREAVFLNTAGGIAGGDEFKISIRADNCAITATTQAAERIYDGRRVNAHMHIHLDAREKAQLHWLPQETILFQGAALERHIHLDMDEDCECLLAETLIFGREAMGEIIEQCQLNDQWRLYCAGKLFHAEAMKIDDDAQRLLQHRAGGNGARFLSTIIYAGPQIERRMQGLNLSPTNSEFISAVSSWNQKIIIRLLGPNCHAARRELYRILQQLRQTALPRVWPQH